MIIIFSNWHHSIFYNRVVMYAVEDRKSYHMITCILAMLPCCGCSVNLAMILAQPISNFNTILVCRLVNQMHISGMYGFDLTHCKYNKVG